jgi:hypothetical protein
MYYPPSPDKPPPWWLETFIIMRAIFGILFWPFIALIVGIGAVLLLFFFLTVHWALALLFLLAVALAFVAFGYWEKRRSPPSLE